MVAVVGSGIAPLGFLRIAGRFEQDGPVRAQKAIDDAAIQLAGFGFMNEANGGISQAKVRSTSNLK